MSYKDKDINSKYRALLAEYNESHAKLMKMTTDLKVFKNDNELLKKQIDNIQENYTQLFEEKQIVNVNLQIDTLDKTDVYKMLHVEKSKNVQQNRE